LTYSLDDEAVLEARFFEDFQEPIRPFGCAKFRLTAITTAGECRSSMKAFGHPDRIVRRMGV
jgi:hypothetical protein